MAKEKEPVGIREGKGEVKNIMGQWNEGLITSGERYNKVVDIWSKATEQVTEQMLDAIGSITEVQTKFSGVPLGQSAIQIVDANGGNRFLDLFGRPDRDSVCTCDRRAEPTLNQVLHLINGETIEAKLNSSKNRLTRLLAAKATPEEILEELFLATYSRLPRQDERERVMHSIASAKDKARQAWEDVLWSMLNSKEFLFQH